MFDDVLRNWTIQRSFVQDPRTPTVRRESIVVAFHPEVIDIGHSILDSGGNAFDAFVAATAAQNVIGEGASSLAGPLNALLYDREQRRVTYLDADYNDPLDPEWHWEPDMPKDGRSALAPGAPAGLAALVESRCTRSLPELLEPAIRLAEDGFPVSRLMNNFIAWRADALSRTDYGRRTYFSADGEPLAPGEILRLPEVAGFLRSFAEKGPAHVYSGDWGQQFLAVVQADNGVLTEADLAAYEVRWDVPRTAKYRGYTLYSSSGHAYGGVWTLLALGTLSHTVLPFERHYSDNADLLQLVVEIARQVWTESWILDYQALDDRSLVESRLSSAYCRQIWDRVQRRLPSKSIARAASHSYHIITRDKHGNAVSGTTTIQADPWGEGIFVEGLPVTTAGSIPWSTAPGTRRLGPFSMHLVFRDGALRFALGGISNSAAEAAFQFLVNRIDYAAPVEQVVSLPRFGTFPERGTINLRKNWLDPRIDSRIVWTLRKRGLRFERRGTIDTGLGAVMAAELDGTLSGVATPVPYIGDPLATHR